MRISRVYYDGPLNSNAVIRLPEETSHYLLRVLRLRQGSKLILFNGAGGEYLAVADTMTKKHLDVTILEFRPSSNESPVNIHLAQSIGKGEKMDWIIQKAVELGVSQITPLITEHGNVRFEKEKSDKKIQHWQKIIISACEQSGRSQLPILDPITTFTDFIYFPRVGLNLFCDPNAAATFSGLSPAKKITIIIGPEGGLSAKEINEAREAAFIGISLGPRILRTETAAIAALAITQNIFGDLSTSRM